MYVVTVTGLVLLIVVPWLLVDLCWDGCLVRATASCLNKEVVNPLDSEGNYSATLNNVKLVHWPLMGGLLHLV